MLKTKIEKEIRKIIRMREKENLGSEKIFHKECPKCGFSEVTKNTLKEWYRLHKEHFKKNLFQKIRGWLMWARN